MAYKKDQGRYTRMAAFGGLFLLAAYGCLHAGGLVYVLNNLLGPDLAKPWIRPFPLLGELGLGVVLTLLVLGIATFLIARFLNRPKAADLLIDTEGELRKVTWPTTSETVSGTVAVAITVTVLLVYLTVADLALTALMKRLLGIGG